MREIKFRGIDSWYNVKNNGRAKNVWRYGSLTVYENGQCGITDILDAPKLGSGRITAEVIPETVGQYTGLKDKNGVEIYEGDVLASGGAEEWYIGGCVSYCDDKDCILAGGFFLAEDTEGHVSDFWEGDWSEIVVHMEVIGNVHDNPELMGVE